MTRPFQPRRGRHTRAATWGWALPGLALAAVFALSAEKAPMSEAELMRLLFPGGEQTAAEEDAAEAAPEAKVQARELLAAMQAVQRERGKWQLSAAATVHAGATDNVLQSAATPEESAYLEAELEVSAFRHGSARGLRQHAFASFSGTTYAEPADAPHESFSLLHLQHSQNLGPVRGGVQAMGFALEQIAEDPFLSKPGGMQIRLWHAEVQPFVEKQWGAYALRLAAELEREAYALEGLSFNAAGAHLRGRRDLLGGEVEVAASWLTRAYDERLARTAEGRRLEGKVLELQRFGLALKWSRRLAAWRIRAGAELRRDWDPAGAYDDLLYTRGTLRLDWKKGRWEARLGASVTHYAYLQRLAQDGQRERVRLSGGLEPQVSYEFSDDWRVSLGASLQLLRGNNPADDYEVRRAHTSLTYTF
ncbi:MAG: hypothetical protein ACLFR7_06860 [Opitutales bacterium]